MAGDVVYVSGVQKDRLGPRGTGSARAESRVRASVGAGRTSLKAEGDPFEYPISSRDLSFLETPNRDIRRPYPEGRSRQTQAGFAADEIRFQRTGAGSEE